MLALDNPVQSPPMQRSTRRRASCILDSSGRPIEAAFFDNAATHRMNERHWQHAQGGDFNDLLRQDLRTLRLRARYEILNNSYGSGIADTLAFDIVGSGPYPQLSSGYEAFDDEAEIKFVQWAAKCDWGGQMDLAEILQMQMALQQCEAGESLTALRRDSAVRRGIRLRLMCIEIDRLGTMWQAMLNPKIVDGIEYDDSGRPIRYYILQDRPGVALAKLAVEPSPVSAEDIIHLYRIKRPGQQRGVPWFAPSIGTFAQLRQFAQATLDSAVNSANTTGTIETDGLEPVEVEPLDPIELERNMMLTMPAGWKVNYHKPEHPATTFQMFKNEIINEIGRGVLMPFNVAAMNSSRYNYASGRLDHQKYHRFITCIRHWGERRFLQRVFAAWMEEAYLTPGFFVTRPTLEQAWAAIENLRWVWPGFKHVDPVKEAEAQTIKLNNGTITLEDCYAEEGGDWKRKLRQRAIEASYKNELMQEFGLTPDELDSRPPSAVPSKGNNNETPEEDDDKTKTQTED